LKILKFLILRFGGDKVNFKKMFAAAALTTLGTVFISTMAFASDITVKLNGKEIYFEDQQAEIVEGRTLVPLRGVFDSMGFDVEWDASTRSAEISNSLNDITMTENINRIVANTRTIDIDVAPQILNGRLMIPLRAVAESVDADVEWDGNSRTVSIYYNKNISVDSSIENVGMDEQQYLKTLISIKDELRDVVNSVPDAVLTSTVNMGNFFKTDNTAVTSEQYDEIENRLDKLEDITPPKSMENADECVKEYVELFREIIDFSRNNNQSNTYDKDNQDFMASINDFKSRLEDINSRFGNYLLDYFIENKVFWESIYGESVIDLLLY